MGLASLTAVCACEYMRGRPGDRLGLVLFSESCSMCSPGVLLGTASSVSPFRASRGPRVLCSLLLGVEAFLLFSPLF